MTTRPASLENGARLGWLIDPADRRVEVYEPLGTRRLEQPEELDGGDVLPGFRLRLAEVWS